MRKYAFARSLSRSALRWLTTLARLVVRLPVSYRPSAQHRPPPLSVIEFSSAALHLATCCRASHCRVVPTADTCVSYTRSRSFWGWHPRAWSLRALRFSASLLRASRHQTPLAADVRCPKHCSQRNTVGVVCLSSSYRCTHIPSSTRLPACVLAVFKYSISLCHSTRLQLLSIRSRRVHPASRSQNPAQKPSRLRRTLSASRLSPRRLATVSPFVLRSPELRSSSLCVVDRHLASFRIVQVLTNPAAASGSISCASVSACVCVCICVLGVKTSEHQLERSSAVATVLVCECVC